MPRGRRGRIAPQESDDSNDDEAPPTSQQDDSVDISQNVNDHDEEEEEPADVEAPAHQPTNSPDENTLRILLSTDNHLGYLERDPIRGNDSFAALEEVLSLARSHHVDFVLLSGDVFHENKPSRRTMHRTMEIMRRYCMGGESVGFQIVSDQGECLRSVVTGRANYEDEFYSVDLPIFAIHGNHDDPTRDGGTEMLSALDLLSVSNLINYFGRQDQVDDVNVSPVLIQKGDTKLALYGMGSMRDERLNRMWQGKKVRFLKPDDSADNRGEDDNGEGNNWFNIFTLHQNRDLGRGTKNCVHESMIPEWMDLVVWGHEHECLINPSDSLVGTFRITQPGSSVATSLTMGEARRKQVGILDVRGQQFRLKPVPLGSVRSFALGDASLSEWVEEGKLDREDPKVEERMADLLAEEVEKLIQRAREDAEHLRQDIEAQAQENADIEDEFDPDKRSRRHTLQYPDQVLVRLKVEHSGFTTLNNQRFGSRFVGEVANPSDILLFHKKRGAESANSKGGAAKKKQAKGLNVPSEPEDLEEINVEDLVNDNLVNSDKKLQLLNEKDMAEALDDFVAKELKQAIGDKAAQCLKSSQKQLKRRGRKEGDEDGDDDVAIDNPTAIREYCMSKSDQARAELALEREEATAKKKKKEMDKSQQILDELNSPESNKKSRGKDDSSDEDDYRPTAKKSKAATTTKKSTAKPSRKNIYDDSDDDMEEDSPPPKKRATSKATTTSKKSTSKRTISRADDSSDDEVQFAGTSQSMSQRAPRAARSTAKKTRYNDDSDMDEEIEEVDAPPPKKRATAKKASSQSQSTLTAFTSARKPVGRGRGAARPTYEIDSDSGSDDAPPRKNGRGGGGWGNASSQNTAAKRGRR